jgi:hypothetical protein
MEGKFKLVAKTALIVVGGSLIGWMAYWAGFSKSLEIGLFVNQRNWSSQAAEYDRFVSQLDSGKADEVRAELKAMSAMLREQAAASPGAPNSVMDLLIPTGGLALLRDYEASRPPVAEAKHNH